MNARLQAWLAKPYTGHERRAPRIAPTVLEDVLALMALVHFWGNV